MPSLLMNALGSEVRLAKMKLACQCLNNPRLNVIKIIPRDLRIRGDRDEVGNVSSNGQLHNLIKLDT